jgi:hypothetical protein
MSNNSKARNQLTKSLLQNLKKTERKLKQNSKTGIWNWNTIVFVEAMEMNAYIYNTHTSVERDEEKKKEKSLDYWNKRRRSVV